MSAETASQREDLGSTVAGTIARARAERAHRTRVRNEARVTRAQARRLRHVTSSSRDAALAVRWSLWSAGVIAGPPGLFPASWAGLPDLDDGIRAARRECRDLAVRSSERLALVTALCQVTVQRLGRLDEDTTAALSLTARMLDRVETDLTGQDVETVLLASACRRCAAACRRALVLLYREGLAR